jgi:hypothetical protein
MRAALGWEIERVDEGQEGLLARVLGQSWQEVYIFLIVFFKKNLYFFLILNLLKISFNNLFKFNYFNLLTRIITQIIG